MKAKEKEFSKSMEYDKMSNEKAEHVDNGHTTRTMSAEHGHSHDTSHNTASSHSHDYSHSTASSHSHTFDGETVVGASGFHDNPAWAVGDINVATHVSDDMSFSEAFAAARAEVGPGGAFEWHGQVYGTYYATEWNNMSAHDRAEFGSHIDWGQVGHNTGYNAPSHNDVVEAEVVDDTTSDDLSVEVIGYEHVDAGDGTEFDVAHLDIEGHEAFVIDYDGDGLGDVFAVDVDGDHNITDGEMVMDADIPMAPLQDAWGFDSLATDGSSYADDDADFMS